MELTVERCVWHIGEGHVVKFWFSPMVVECKVFRNSLALTNMASGPIKGQLLRGLLE